MNNILDLWSGRVGLAKSYWLWGILFSIPWGIALSLVTPGSNLAILLVSIFFVYYVIINVGIWRAASEYDGAKVLAILAKISVAITPVCLVIGTLAAVIIPATHQPSKQVQQATPTTQISKKNENPISDSINLVQRNISEDQKLLREQGIGGNQDIFDVKSWGNEQLSARSFYGEDLTKAHAFAVMWQRQIIYKLKISPERSLFLGYSIVLNHIDQDNALCRPDMKKNGGVEDDEGGYLNAHPECFKK